MAMYTVL